MRQSFRVLPAVIAGSLLVLLPLTRAGADDSDDQTQPKTEQSQAKAVGTSATAADPQAKKEQDIPEYDLWMPSVKVSSRSRRKGSAMAA